MSQVWFSLSKALLLVSVLLLAACGGGTASDAPATGDDEGDTASDTPATDGVNLGEEQTNEAGGYAFTPPADWQVQTDPFEGGSDSAVGLFPPGDKQNFFILMTANPPDYYLFGGEEVTLEALADSEATTGLFVSGMGLSAGAPRETMIGGEDALTIDLEGSVEGEAAQGLIVVAMIDEQRVFNANVVGPESEYDSALVDAVLASVRFVEPTEAGN
jgi:hypothetical protein